MLTLVLGGTRSGKSQYAERLANGAALASGSGVTYVATGSGSDGAMRARIAAHRGRRPDDWATIEVVDPDLLVPTISALDGVVLVDSLGSWVAATDDMAIDAPGLVEALRQRGDASATVVVSEEVGLSVHPPTDAGRRFVDVLGDLNQAVAAVASRSVLVIAGKALELG